MLDWLFKKIHPGADIFGKPLWVLEWEGRSFDGELFFKSIPKFLPQETLLYLEGNPDSEVELFLKQNAVPETLKIAAGTIWPKPDIYHLPGNKNVFDALAKFSSRKAIHDICYHFMAYKDGIILLSGYDFGDDPIYMAEGFSREEISSLSLELGCSFRFDEKM